MREIAPKCGRTVAANRVRACPDNFDRLTPAEKAAAVSDLAKAVGEALSLPAALLRRANGR